MSALDIICEDGPVIAVNKPSGILVQGAPRGVPTLADLVRDYLRVKYNKPGNVYLGIPHRLDRPVSGAVVFSRNSKCAARLSEQFAQRQVRKLYHAVLTRPMEQGEGTLVDWLARIPDRSQVRVTRESDPDARQAVLHYRTLCLARGRALVEIELETGRMHQIRIQFGSRGCPIVGDVQYGARDTWIPHRSAGFRALDGSDTTPIALHARQLTLLHPIRYDELTIVADPPEAWQQFGMPANAP